ncbi:hypothetical protein GCM10009841_19030 [Microlunatus panaciterrae]|uniref:Uncharacterized protein n=1 Tax=Microlunatus panaciterrae TaxID=400768 RepID=A0ABS2RQL4_9ACTN|nr:hypothetical protein [Microlunatus panaciterrae]MBM7800461.1 hypothetical protein [Microlunatus panaciterrae]
MTTAEHEPQQEPPARTGDPTIDEALSSLQDLDGEPVANHHARLAHVHEVLHGALHPDR